MRKLAAVIIALLCGALASCGTADPLAMGEDSDTTIVVGSQAYYSNEIIAEIYSQALEESGYAVQRDFQIGQREIYMPELEAGTIDVIPEYTGNLLQYYRQETSATTPDAVYSALTQALPTDLVALEQSEASDQDSYVVTKEFAREHGVVSIADLAKVEGLVLGGNSELESRPYGPKGLASVYGVHARFTPIEDSGGSLTIKALRDDAVQIVDVYSANPVLAEGDLLVLEDPQGLFVSSRVVPIVHRDLPIGAARVLNAVSGQLTAADLAEMNARSSGEGLPSSTIAREWLAAHPVGK